MRLSTRAVSDAAGPASARPVPAPLPRRPHGPFDITEAAAAPEVARADVGSLLVPVPDGTVVQVSIQAGVPVEVIARCGPWRLRLSVFAAPRSRRTWPATAEEIAQAWEQDGAVERTDGPFGPRLSTVLDDDGHPVRVYLWGVDGPGWMVRAAVQSAPADQIAADPDEQDGQGTLVGGEPQLDFAADGLPVGVLGDIVRGLVVRRTAEPAPVGSRLALSVSPELLGEHEMPHTLEEPAASRYATWQ